MVFERNTLGVFVHLEAQGARGVTDVHMKNAIREHYERQWGRASIRHWPFGPVEELPSGFAVLEFPPRDSRGMWTYATLMMSNPSDDNALELHIFSPRRDMRIVELLTVVSHYHATESRLGLGHTVNFGRSWLDDSQCTHGLISLPYLDGPAIERSSSDGLNSRFLWLIPVTPGEVMFKKQRGLEALEQRLESASFDYVDVDRPSVV